MRVYVDMLDADEISTLQEPLKLYHDSKKKEKRASFRGEEQDRERMNANMRRGQEFLSQDKNIILKRHNAYNVR